MINFRRFPERLGKVMVFSSRRARSMAGTRTFFLSAVAAAALVLGPGAAQAQFFDRPAAPAQAPDGAEAASTLRIDRLENQVRNLNGQVEQLQFQVKRLEDQLRKFQMDVDSRLTDGAASGAAKPIPGAPPAARPAASTTPQRRSELPDTAVDAPAVAGNLPPLDETAESAPAADPAPPAGGSLAAAAGAPVALGPDGRRHDAFDPSAAPTAPGAPLALGSAESASRPPSRSNALADARPGAEPAAAPLDLTPPALRGANVAASPASAVPSTTPAAVASLPANSAAAAPADPVKLDYDAAAEQLRSQHYDAAQQAFSAFVQKNPHSRLIAPALYHLGESYYYQNRHREAAEQFLKIATDYARSPVAPDAMVKLGVSLNALGAKEQACAFFSELPRKYPNAAAAQKLAAEREAKKASC
jgi:tol-pal system protein YbgF